MGVKKIPQETYPQYTVQEWEQWEGHWELIKGIPWAMSPMPSSRHQEIGFELARLLANELAGCSNYKVYMPINLKIDEQTVLHPDLSVICDPPRDFLYYTKAPEMVVEILSPSTAQKDLNTKAVIYAELGVRCYGIVHPTEEWVRIQILENSEWLIVFEGHEGTFEFDFQACKASVDFVRIWG